MKKYLIVLLFCPLFTLAQNHTDLQERALKGKIKTIVQYDYNKEVSKLKGEKITDSLLWYRKIIYHYDTLGNLQKKEAYIKRPPQYEYNLITDITIIKKENNETVAEHFDEKNRLQLHSKIKETSDTTYTITTYDAKTNTIRYENEQTLNANYRDIAGKFSYFMLEDGINKLQQTTEYKNTLDSNGRLLKSAEKDYSTLAIIETIYKYLAFDKKGNPTKIVQEKFNKPVMLTTRLYSYYE